MRSPNYIARILVILAGLSVILLVCPSCRGKRQDHNRLSNASSPYLQAQARNPVDWYEWGDEALEAAKKEDKPLLVSIGYSSCHWCHVMEKESFMDTAVARLMNEDFICIKVDREERPDIDNVYTTACQLISGSSGWPLNAFALPDGKPFFAGTYYSRQSWTSLLTQIASAYHTQKGKVDLQAKSLANGIAGLELSVLTDTAADLGDRAAYRHLFEGLYGKMDLTFGGLKGNPKFPNPSSLDFLLQYYFLAKDKRALDAATVTLTKMALGGIYDQIGGGFARYSIDSLWHIPHFEKMLYDNAQLLSVYTHAYQLTHNPFFKRILQETAGFIQRDLRSPDGGYFCSLDADNKEGEGEFYTWTAGELRKILPGSYTQLAGYYHITEEGNWKDNKNVLFAGETPVQFALSKRLDPAGFSIQLDASRQVMLSERNKRERPSVDDKILTSWNAVLMTGYLDAYAALGNEGYLQNALGIARFLEKKMIRGDGGLWRVCKDGKASVNGLLEDYAFFARACIRLYELTFDKHWLDRARQLAGSAIDNFYDPGSGMFYYTANRAETAVIRKIGISDDNLPSSNAIMADVLYSLSVYFQDDDYLKKSTHMISRVTDQLHKEGAGYYASWCLLPGLFSYGSNEVAILGKDALARGLEMQKNYLPFSIFMGSSADESLPLLQGKTSGPSTDKSLPLLQGKASGTKTLIYVCVHNSCRRPVETSADGLKLLIK